jgi:hypothetical protein
MKVVNGFVRNLIILFAIGLVFIVFFPHIMREVSHIIVELFGLVMIVLLIIVAASPGRRR